MLIGALIILGSGLLCCIAFFGGLFLLDWRDIGYWRGWRDGIIAERQRDAKIAESGKLDGVDFAYNRACDDVAQRIREGK